MRHLCSRGRCTAVGTRVLVFDAAPAQDGTIGIRAHVYACDRHRDELAEAIKAYADTDAEKQECAVWYDGRGGIDYDLCDDETEAASVAAGLYESDDAPTILGVQFADGRLVKADQWEAFTQAKKAQAAMWAEAYARPRPAMRTVRDPFTGEAVDVEADEPGWLGR